MTTDVQPQQPEATAVGRHAAADESGVKPASAVQDAGLIAFIENLRAAGDEAKEARDLFAELARMAEEDQPAHQSVASGLRTVAEMLGTAASVGEGITPNAKTKHRDDYERGEQPRGGSRQVEAKADVDRAVREGAV
jgi:hypothetical protein